MSKTEKKFESEKDVEKTCSFLEVCFIIDVRKYFERRLIMAKTIRELTEDLLNAHSACKEIKEAAKNYLDAVGTEKEAEAAKLYIAELEADIMSIDGLIGFAESDMGAKIFGEEAAKNILAHAKERKAAGEKYCDCPACAACEALLNRKNEILK